MGEHLRMLEVPSAVPSKGRIRRRRCPCFCCFRLRSN